MKRTLITFLTVLVALILPASTAAAASPEPEAMPVVTEGRGSTQVLEALNALSGTQSASSIEAVLESGLPIETLYDPMKNEIVAAAIAQPSFSTFAVTPIYAGCPTGAACMKGASGAGVGFTGSGSVWGTWSGIRYL